MELERSSDKRHRSGGPDMVLESRERKSTHYGNGIRGESSMISTSKYLFFLNILTILI